MKAHIYPQSFFRDRSAPGSASVLLGKRQLHAKKSPTGLYDSEILCGPCDRRLGVYDDYGHSFFKLKDAKCYSNGERIVGWWVQVDYEKLKLFLLAVLWRASVSGRPECAGTDLGIHEERIRRMLDRGIAGPASRYSIVLERYEEGAEFSPPSLPRRGRPRRLGVWSYKLELAGCVAWLASTNGRSLPSRKRCNLPLDALHS